MSGPIKNARVFGLLGLDLVAPRSLTFDVSRGFGTIFSRQGLDGVWANYDELGVRQAHPWSPYLLLGYVFQCVNVVICGSLKSMSPLGLSCLSSYHLPGTAWGIAVNEEVAQS